MIGYTGGPRAKAQVQAEQYTRVSGFDIWPAVCPPFHFRPAATRISLLFELGAVEGTCSL